MKRTILPVAALALAAACSDANSPSSDPSVLPDAPAQTQPFAAGADPAEASALAVRQLWAVVGLNGTLTRGSRVTGTTKLGPGQYEVTFDRSVTGCAYVATTQNAYSQAITVFTASGHLSPNGVYVETKNQGGGLTDGPFNLLVACGPLGTRFAVVGTSSNLVRSTPGTTLTDLGSGRYNVQFANPVTGCAYLATVGDPANALVFSPAGVYTGSGPDSRTVYIETKNPGGGLQPNIPFHLALVCANTGSARYAVIKASGVKKRASIGTSSSRPTTGTYAIGNNIGTGSCAAIATRGSVDTAVPFSPATVEILPGQGGTSYGVQVRSLLFFGGAVSNQAIHAALIC